MLQKLKDRLSALSWFAVVSVVLLVVSFGYMVLALYSLAIYFLLAAILFTMWSYRE